MHAIIGRTRIWNTRNILQVVISKIELRLRKKNHVKNTKFYKPRNSFLAVAPTPSLPLSFWGLEKKLWWQGTLRWRLFLRRLHLAAAAPPVPRRWRSSRPRGWPSAAVLPIGLWPRLLYRGHRGRPSTMASIMYFCPKSQKSICSSGRLAFG